MWIILISIGCGVSLVMVLALCSCWRRKREKDEWLGLDGMVTQKNPDENVNHLPSAQLASELQQQQPTSGDDNEPTVGMNKRPITVSSNTRRSLPDIPMEIQMSGRGDNWLTEANGGDNSSELYATVEPYAKRHTLPNGIDSMPSFSQQQDDAFAPYASVNYDKLNNLEHPYAIVKPPNSTGSLGGGSAAVQVATESVVDGTSGRSDDINSTQDVLPPLQHSRRSSSSSHSVHIDINAASAVAGGVAASQDLPYMTPPIAQTNFSGDSQDSSKGYTSISVREPLATIIAQTKEMNKIKRSLDPHYSTVSDDSDEMYTTIPDNSNNLEYTSGSETYAQIQPLAITAAASTTLVAADINPVPSASSNDTSVVTLTASDGDAAPQPPSVNSLKCMTQSHSRQADHELFAASSTSSILNLGSPKPEKRKANSPLPPPPTNTNSNNNASSSSNLTNNEFHAPPPASPPQNLDDMYAKVHKNRNKKSKLTAANSEATSSESNTSTDATLHNYETLKKTTTNCSSNDDPGYEKLRLKDGGEPGYASINSDPGYEVLNKSDGYAVINKQQQQLKQQEQVDDDDDITEPNYESVSQHDPNYESVKYLDVTTTTTTTTTNTDDSESSNKTNDSGYERLMGSSSTEQPPPYEKLNDDDTSSSGYEKIAQNNQSSDDLDDDEEEDEDAIFEV